MKFTVEMRKTYTTGKCAGLGIMHRKHFECLINAQKYAKTFMNTKGKDQFGIFFELTNAKIFVTDGIAEEQ